MPYLFRLFLIIRDWVLFDRSHHCRSRFSGFGGSEDGIGIGDVPFSLSPFERRFGVWLGVCLISLRVIIEIVSGSPVLGVAGEVERCSYR